MKADRSNTTALQRKIWYLAPTALNGVVSIASVPLLILFIGSTGWAEIALGQAVGLFGSVLVGLGWPIVGPAIMANSSLDTQYEQYILSLWARLTVAAVVTAFTVGLILTFFPQSTLLLWTAIASSLLGCASSWYFLGIDDPRGLFWRDAFARSLGTGCGLLGVALTGLGEFFAIGLFLGLLVSMLLTWQCVRSRRSKKLKRVTPRAVMQSISSQRSGLSANVLFVGLSTLALPLTALVGGQVFVTFAILDKVQKQLTTVALPLTQLITGKMAGDLGRGEEPTATAQRTFRSVAISGSALCFLMIFLGPLAVDLMSVGTVSVDIWTTLVLAAVVGLAFVAQCLPIAVLAPIRKLKFSLWGMSAAIFLGAPAIMYCGIHLGTTSVMVSLSLMYALSIVFGFVGLRVAVKQINGYPGTQNAHGLSADSSL